MLKEVRSSQRSDPTFWQRFVPWVTDSQYPGTPFQFRDDNNIQAGRPYWFEFMFHVLLHGTKFLQYYDSDYTPADTQEIHEVLDEWRTISNNSRAQPCTNSTGDINQLLDRIDLAQAFDKYLISGGHMLKTGKYLWRITIPPKFFYNTGSVTLQRVGTDDDIPATIIINGSGADNASRGVWIKRSVTTPPAYTIS